MGIILDNLNLGGGTTSYTELLEALYPIGSLYMGIQDVCPLETLGIGTWSKLNSGRVLQISDDEHSAGTTVEAGLPNITGNIYRAFAEVNATSEGAFYLSNNYSQNNWEALTTNRGWRFNFDASRSNPIYGASDTVQPSAFIVNIWQRIL